jgi:hypothetical protein
MEVRYLATDSTARKILTNLLARSGKRMTPMVIGIASVYLSARFGRRDQLNAYRADLAEMGIEVTSRWLTNPVPELTNEAWRRLASTDREDVERADALILFAEEERDGGGGRHVEFGMALALKKRVIVVGAIENLFQRLPDVSVVQTWDEAVQRLMERTV